MTCKGFLKRKKNITTSPQIVIYHQFDHTSTHSSRVFFLETKLIDITIMSIINVA